MAATPKMTSNNPCVASGDLQTQKARCIWRTGRMPTWGTQSEERRVLRAFTIQLLFSFICGDTRGENLIAASQHIPAYVAQCCWLTRHYSSETDNKVPFYFYRPYSTKQTKTNQQKRTPHFSLCPVERAKTAISMVPRVGEYTDQWDSSLVCAGTARMKAYHNVGDVRPGGHL